MNYLKQLLGWLVQVLWIGAVLAVLLNAMFYAFWLWSMLLTKLPRIL